MILCNFCRKPIPKERANFPKTKYCSTVCNKRSYYVRNLRTNERSIYKNRKDWYDTETGKGFLWEVFTAKILKAQHQPFGSEYDLVWNGKTVDVKTSNLYIPSNKKTGWWRFDRGEKKKNIDYFFCIGLYNNVPQKMLLIPGEKFGNRGITMTPKKSIYDIYTFIP